MRVIDGSLRGVMVAGLLASVGGGCSGGEAREAAAPPEPSGRMVSVEVMELTQEPFTEYVQVVGTVEPNREVTVSAEEAGTIRELMVQRGAVVRAGQPIARIDDRVLRPQAEQAASEAALARETYERQERLWREDGVGTEIGYLRAMYAAQSAEAGARMLRERLDRTLVRAPLSGVVDTRSVEVGTLVSAGTPIARLIDVATVKISGGVPERFAGQVVRGSQVDVMLDALGPQPFSGEVSFVGPSVDPSNRTFPIEITVANPHGDLKPGLIANVRVARRTIESALVVPQEAVLRTEDGYVAYVVRESGSGPVAEARPVVLGPTQANRVMVDAGLEPGDRLVVVGQHRVAPGDRLQIVGARRGGIDD